MAERVAAKLMPHVQDAAVQVFMASRRPLDVGLHRRSCGEKCHRKAITGEALGDQQSIRLIPQVVVGQAYLGHVARAGADYPRLRLAVCLCAGQS